MKKFYVDWSDREINDYISEHSVLILFKIHKSVKEAELIVHGKMNKKQKILLTLCITGEFGGKGMTEDLCIKINEYAEAWYNIYVKAPRKIRVLNFGRKGA